MMKTIEKLFLGLLLLVFLAPTDQLIAQEKVEYKPVLLTITTLHRANDFDYDAWLKTEKEYFKKVTSKNELLIGSGYYFHYFTDDASEVKSVSVYKNWIDIEESDEITTKLIEAGWPDEEVRKEFFKKKNSFFGPMHSDEIYQTTRFRKPLKTESKKPLIYYVKKNLRGNGDGSGWVEYFDNVTMKNTTIKGYYTHMHKWGANSLDALEVFVLDNFSDIEKMFNESEKLIKDHWTDEAKRNEFMKSYSKLFSGHGDYIYMNVPEVSK